MASSGSDRDGAATPASGAPVHADAPGALRSGGRDWLSLALIDARNHTLRWLAAFEAAASLHASGDGGAAPLWLAGRAGHWQEWTIARNVQRARGEAADPAAPRLASLAPQADAWFASGGEPPDAARIRAYLGETLELTLDALAVAPDDDEGLVLFRLALLHEDRIGETLAERAAALQLADAPGAAAPWRELPTHAPREPLWMPARRWMLGSVPGGLVPENERWAHELAIPEFEIDALPVSWSRYVEFADDAGYDRRELWSDEGWAWLAASGRRAPRHVEQWCGAVIVQRRGRLERAAPAQPALHLTRHEAEAWCRWAGRRLPTEPEWELAACTAASRGFCWGEVHEWTAGSARPWPGHASVATGLDPVPPAAERSGFGVLRGASWMTRLRARHPKARRFVRPADDTAFCGFRSCALG